MSTPPSISSAPAEPDRRDVSTFASRAEAFVRWLVLLIPQLREAMTYINGRVTDAALAESARIAAQAAAALTTSHKNTVTSSLTEVRSLESSARNIRDATLSVHDAEGIRAFPATKAAADALSLNNGDIVEVQVDETQDDHRVRYTKTNSGLELLLDMDVGRDTLAINNLTIAMQLLDKQVEDRIAQINF